MQIDRCLCCGKALDDATSVYHKSCAKKLFGSQQIPALNYTLEELNELAKNTILDRISVPGVQPKLSLHLERGAKDTAFPADTGRSGGQLYTQTSIAAVENLAAFQC